MCGIVGFLNPKGFSSDRTESVATNMANVLSHRGPDDSGVWLERKTGIALAFRRLAIIDLSLSGHQPMLSHSGRYVLIFNGEIYNHRELQAELIDGGWNNAWRGHSDTEILLSAIEFWGVDKAIPKTVGMFAIALWDRQEEILYLVRDRIGEKPLYYGWNNGVFFSLRNCNP